MIPVWRRFAAARTGLRIMRRAAPARPMPVRSRWSRQPLARASACATSPSGEPDGPRSANPVAGRLRIDASPGLKLAVFRRKRPGREIRPDAAPCLLPATTVCSRNVPRALHNGGYASIRSHWVRSRQDFPGSQLFRDKVDISGKQNRHANAGIRHAAVNIFSNWMSLPLPDQVSWLHVSLIALRRGIKRLTGELETGSR